MIAINLGSGVYEKNARITAVNMEFTHRMKVLNYKRVVVKECFPDKIIPREETYLIPTTYEMLSPCDHNNISDWIKGSPGYEYKKCFSCNRKFVRRRK